MKEWFNVDRKGLSKIMERKGKEFILFELLQNAWDEPGVTKVFVALCEDSLPGYSMIVVTDDAPAGFQDLAHSYTLFAESKKKSDATKRGRFNLGEKLVLAMCKEATITTTTGGVRFDEDGRHRINKKLPSGSEVRLILRMNAKEREALIQSCKKLIPPSHIETTINQGLLPSCIPLTQFQSTLTTEIANDEGYLARSQRNTTVDVFQASDDRPAAIYELGIPVCEIEGRYVINVNQKVPLTMDREEVLPSFRKQLSVAVLNHMAQHMDKDDVNTGWVTEAVASLDAKPEALQSYMDTRFGEKRVAYDPSDPEANNIAVSQGYTVVTGSQLSRAAWGNVKEAGAILPAGQVTPSPKAFSEQGDQLPFMEPTPHMKEVEEYAKRVAYEVLGGVNITVSFTPEKDWGCAAAFGPKGVLYFNAGALGESWFWLKHNQQEIDDLLIHELAHYRVSNHLSRDYYKELTRIGAALAAGIRAGRL